MGFTSGMGSSFVRGILPLQARGNDKVRDQVNLTEENCKQLSAVEGNGRKYSRHVAETPR